VIHVELRKENPLIDLCDQELHTDYSDFIDTVKRLIIKEEKRREEKILNLETLAETTKTT